MKLSHLTALSLVCGALLGPAVARAADWPQSGKVIELIVPAPGGGGTGDHIARVLAEQLARRMSIRIVVNNRGGANGNIGASLAARSAPDGYRLLFSWAGTLAVNPSLYKNLGFDPRESFEPVGLVADVPNLLVVSKALAVKDLQTFVDYAKARPGKLNFGSTGIGSSMHLAGELFMRETKTVMVHVPYTAPGEATTNLTSNEIQAMFQLIPGILGQVKGGTVHPLAIMSNRRSPVLPDVPTTAESGYPNLLSSTWFALLAPKGTPDAIVDRLNSELNAVLASPDVRKQLAEMGATPVGGTRRELADLMNREIGKWNMVIQQAGVQAQ